MSDPETETRAWLDDVATSLAAERAAARAEVALLREAVERVRSLVTCEPPCADCRQNGCHGVSNASVRALLPPAVPSGEAESGPRDDAAHGIGLDGRCAACDPAPVSSGGQADGEGWYEFLKPVVSTTHIAYVHEDGSVYLPESDVVDEADFHVAQAKGRCWRLLREVDLAARPVLSREALRERINNLINGFILDWVPPRMQGHLLDDDGNDGERLREALADVLAGEQR